MNIVAKIIKLEYCKMRYDLMSSSYCEDSQTFFFISCKPREILGKAILFNPIFTFIESVIFRRIKN